MRLFVLTLALLLLVAPKNVLGEEDDDGDDYMLCDDGKILICHHPPGGGGRDSFEICVSPSAGSDHTQNHGDTRGKCPRKPEPPKPCPPACDNACPSACPANLTVEDGFVLGMMAPITP